MTQPKPREEFLDMALQCGARLTGKPDGSEPITVVFSIEAWRAFDAARANTPQGLTAAARDVLAERQRQISAEGWTPEHDDEHDPGELSAAASSYAIAASDEIHPYSLGDGGYKTKSPEMWPWAESWWKPGADPRQMLVKAGALILAEIERLDRAAPSQPIREKQRAAIAKPQETRNDNDR